MVKNNQKFDEKKLLQLLGQEKYEEAKKIIQEVLASDLTPEERGAALTNMAQLYLELNNKMSERYLATLEDAITTLKAMDKTAHKVEEDLALAAARLGVTQAKKNLGKVY